jgi:hypothetical protein
LNYAATLLGTDATNIRRAALGEAKHAKGFIWKFKTG